jgi:hypothetical protein
MKTFVEVISKFTEEGDIIPLSLKWGDGEVYEIDKVHSIRNRASLRAGGVGLRYECRIRNKDTFIYLEDNRWFVEAK